jgi:hypothetical protein
MNGWTVAFPRSRLCERARPAREQRTTDCGHFVTPVLAELIAAMIRGAWSRMRRPPPTH